MKVLFFAAFVVGMASGQIVQSGGGAGSGCSPVSSPTAGDVATLTSGGCPQDGGVLLTALAPLASPTFTGQVKVSTNGAVSVPPLILSGTWYSGGTSTTTKPQTLVECNSGTTTSTGWSVNGTGLGVNACSGFTGNLLDLQLNGSSKATLSYNGSFAIGVLQSSSYILTPTVYFTNSPQASLQSVTGGGLKIIGINTTGTGDVSACYNATSTQLTYGSVCGSSLAKFKENILPIKDGIAQIMALNPVTFDWRKDSGYTANSVLGMHDVGMIADESAVVNPLFGAWNADGKLQNFRDRAILATLVKAVQEQQSQIEDLKKASTNR